MQYFALLLSPSDAPEERADPAAVEAEMTAYTDFHAREAASIKAGDALTPVAAGVRIKGGPDAPVVTDGPFPESAEIAGGFYVFEADDLDSALALARQIPHARKGAVEVWPMFMEFEPATKLTGETVNLSQPGNFHAYTLREPIGVVGQIIPWNAPLMMAAWKLAPALATGCTVVLKPAEQTPLTALRLGQLIQEAGFPYGVVNIVTGFGETAGAALAAHPGVDKVAFTGSAEVGRLIVKAAACNLKKVSLELGGKSASVILDDADFEAAVRASLNHAFINSGQTCASWTRMLVPRARQDEAIAIAKAELEKSNAVGDPY